MGRRVLVVVLSLATVANADEFSLVTGDSRVLSLQQATVVHVDDVGVLEVQRRGGEIKVVGRAQGKTRLVLQGPGKKRVVHHFTVTDFDERRAAEQLRALLPKVAGLEVAIEHRSPYVLCDACTQEDADRVADVLALYPSIRSVQYPAGPPRSPATVLSGARQLLGEGPDDTPGLTLDVRSGKVVLFGHARNAEDAHRVELLRAAYPEVRVFVRLPLEDGGR